MFFQVNVVHHFINATCITLLLVQLYCATAHCCSHCLLTQCWLLTETPSSWSWELEFVLRPTVSRPVSLGIGPPFGTLDQILSCSFFVWQLRRSACNASSLTRERVCNLLLNCFWALPEQSHLSRSPTELTAISYYLLWDSPNLEGQVPVFISPRNRVAQLYPRALDSLSVASYDSQGLRWRYCNPPPHGVHSARTGAAIGPSYLTPRRTKQKTSLALLFTYTLPGNSYPLSRNGSLLQFRHSGLRP
jgi:hypothetical protein